jgi:sugar phosphate isomerase/epimerase
MRLAVQENLVSGEDVLAKWNLMRRLGFDGLELRGRAGMRERLPELRAARATGLVASSICLDGGPFIGAFEADAREAAVAAVAEMLDVGSELGVRGVITPAAYGLHSNRLPPFAAPRPPEEDRAVLLDGLSRLAEHAALCGVEVWLEPLNRYEDHMVNTLAQGVELVRAVGSPALRLMADLFHMNIEEGDMAAALTETGPLVAHVHLADSSRLEPGTGHTDFAAPFAALRAMGFDGWGAIECRLSGPVEESLARALAALRAAGA